MKNSSGYVDSFRKLIQCPTVTNSGHEYFEEFHKILDEEFPNVANKCEKIELNCGDALLYKLKGKNSNKPMILMGHQDVVPAIGGDWICDPYSATVKDGRIYGRGTMDCKNTIFGSIQALDELIAEGFVPEQDVWFESACTEETDGSGADAITKELVKRGADTIAIASCITKGTPIGFPCPNAYEMEQAIRKAAGSNVTILDYTHNAPPKDASH